MFAVVARQSKVLSFRVESARSKYCRARKRRVEVAGSYHDETAAKREFSLSIVMESVAAPSHSTVGIIDSANQGLALVPRSLKTGAGSAVR